VQEIISTVSIVIKEREIIPEAIKRVLTTF